MTGLATVETAQRYLTRGWCVLPLRPHNKRPLVAWEPFQRMSPSAAQVADDGGRGITFDDSGSVGTNRQSEILFNGYADGFPGIGGAYTMTANFTLTSYGTQVGLSVLGSNATYDTSVALLPASQFYITLVGENHGGEQYQLNWISISSGSGPVVGVPGPIVGTGLPGLIFASGGLLVWWRRKRKQVAA